MQKLREILRHEYIGAITIGFILAQTAGILITSVIRPIDFYVSGRGRQHSVFGLSESTSFPWSTLISPLLTAILYLAVAWLLYFWLYSLPEASSAQPQETTAAADLFE
ncbi:MAG TPA: hypothetical protein VFW31_13165 [Candidatus Angelobacter sp.]|nr:hypothetical protein [Candidatus Angelobacter sp.]